MKRKNALPYLEMVSDRAINDICDFPRRTCIFSSFQFVVLFLIALDNNV